MAHYDGPGYGSDYPCAIAVDNWGNIYVAGRSYSASSRDDYTTIKYDSDGNELWVALEKAGDDLDFALDLLSWRAVDGRTWGSTKYQ